MYKSLNVTLYHFLYCLQLKTGMAATVTALTMALRRMQQRDAVGYQRWLRARVLAQGITVAAFVLAGVQEFGPGVLTGQGTSSSHSTVDSAAVGSASIATSSPSSETMSDKINFATVDPRAPAGTRVAGRSTQEAREFARRLRKAEEAHAAEEAAAQTGESFSSASAGTVVSSSGNGKNKEKGGGWLSWIGLGRSK